MILYMNHNTVNPRFMNICNLLRQEIALAQAAYSAKYTSGNEIPMVKIWDEWIDTEINLVSQRAYEFYDFWYDEMDRKWSNDFDVRGRTVRDSLDQLERWRPNLQAGITKTGLYKS